MNSDGALSEGATSTPMLPNLDRIIRGLLYLYIISLPFVGLLFIERNGFMILLVLLVLWFAVNRRHFFVQTPLDLPLIAFVLWVGFTIPFAAFPLYSLKEFGKLLQQSLMFYVVMYFFQERLHRTRLLTLLVGVLTLISAYGITQFEEMGRLASFLSSEVWLTTYLVMFIPLCFALALYEERPYLRAVYVGVSGLATVCLLLTQSRAGLVALVCELWVLAWFTKRRAMLIVASVLSLALVISVMFLVKRNTTTGDTTIINSKTPILLKTDIGSIIHRVNIWSFTLEQIPKHPFVGIGYGKESYRLVFDQKSEESLPGHEQVRNAGTHNIFLELALHVGLPGLLLFVWLVARIAKTTLAEFHRAADFWSKAVLLGVGVSVIGMGVRLMFDQMFVVTLALLFWILVAVAMLECGTARSQARANIRC